MNCKLNRGICLKRMKNNFFGTHYISVEALTREDVDFIFQKTIQMRELVKTRGGNESLKGKILNALFYEPSTRTFSSFVSAIQRLGGGFIPNRDISSTSVVKGETLSDTIRVLSQFSDCIVLRHPDKGSMEIATAAATVPIINAGDGIGEHPTQGLQDLFTIQEHFGKQKNLHIVFVGAVGYYRPVSSLARLLALYKDISITFVAPKEVGIQKDLRIFLEKKNVSFSEVESLKDVLPQADVLYVTRVKKEYMDPQLYEKVKDRYIITPQTIAQFKKNAIIMHALPTVHEIEESVHRDSRSIYFTTQLRNGLYTKMALLEVILKKE